MHNREEIEKKVRANFNEAFASSLGNEIEENNETEE